VQPYRRRTALIITVIAAAALHAGCARAGTATAVPSASTSATPSASSASASPVVASGSPALDLAPLPACSTLISVVRRHFPNATLGRKVPPQPIPGVGIRQQCNVKASLEQADDPRLGLNVELGRIGQVPDGRSAEAATLEYVPMTVSGLCPVAQPAVADPHFPNTWACKGEDLEILPVAGAAGHGDYVIVILVGEATPSPALLERLTDSTAHLAYDVLQQLSQSR